MKTLLLLSLGLVGLAQAQQVTLTPDAIKRTLGGHEVGLYAQSKHLGCSELQAQLPDLARKYHMALPSAGDFACPNRASAVIEALLMVEAMDALAARELSTSESLQKDARGIAITGQSNPIGALSFVLASHVIEVYDGGVAQGPELMASALAHEIRHAHAPRHDVCESGPLKGLPACDPLLPAWENWKEGGSYVYELAFQKLAIQKKIPGHQKYVRQFIGNLHIRFTQKPSLELIDAWIGPELLQSEREFVNQVRARFY